VLWYRTVLTGYAVVGQIMPCVVYKDVPGPDYVRCIRSVDVYDSQTQYRFVPMILPVLSVSESRTGLGLTLAYAPEIRSGDFQVPTATWMLQMTYRIR